MDTTIADDELRLAASTPAVVRGADDRRAVRARCVDDAVRQSAAVGLLTLPMVAVVALAIDSAEGGRWLIPWILTALVVEIMVVVALVQFRSERARGSAENALGPVHVAFAAVGAVWGAMAFVIDWSGEAHLSAYAMFPFTIAVLTMVQAAPLTSLFRASQISLVAVGTVGLAVAHTTVSIAIAVFGLVWYGLAESLHRSMNTAVVRGHQMHRRADELVDHLRAERRRLAEANALLADQAVHDPLTGLLNRRGTLDAFERMLAAMTNDDGSGERQTHTVGVVFLDLDLFKSVNDSLGHRAGDQLLEVMADRIRGTLSDTAAVGRFGGDEMIAVIPDCRDLDDLVEIAGRVRAAIAQPVVIDGREMSVSASIGLSLAPDHGTDAGDLLRTANAGLHRAKARGRNRVVAFDETLRDEIQRQRDHEDAVRAAIDAHEIEAVFVPEFDAVTNRLVGAEIAPRWRCRPSDGTADLDLTSTHLDVTTQERVTTELLREARPSVRRLAVLGLPAGFRFRLRVTSRASVRTWSEQHLRDLLRGIDPSVVTVSVTEQAIRHDLTLAAAALGAFRALGIRVALDDVAAASSSLSVLRTVPLDEIRIDRSSLEAVESRPHDRAIVRAIVGLGRDLGLTVSAVGVESGAQADALIALGCVRQQGDHFSLPLSADALMGLLVLKNGLARAEHASGGGTR
jgi:diguanylate cyclase (GGDEF)-like protein